MIYASVYLRPNLLSDQSIPVQKWFLIYCYLCVDRLGPLRSWTYYGLSFLHLQGQGQRGPSHDVVQLVNVSTYASNSVPGLCSVLSHVYSLQPLSGLPLFRWGNGLRAVGWFVRGCSPGLQRVGHDWATNTWYDVTWGEGVLHPKLPAPQDLLSLVSPSCRGDARQKKRNEWSRERGSLNVCCLLASHEAQVINKVLMPSILNECQLFRRNHMSRKHQWHRWIVPCLCNGIFTAHLPGSWRKLGIWATLVSQANPGYELCGAYHPPQSRVKQCGLSGRENRLILPGYNLEASQQGMGGMQGMGAFGQCPGCSPHVPRFMPSEGRKVNLFLKYT